MTKSPTMYEVALQRPTMYEVAYNVRSRLTKALVKMKLIFD